MLPDLPLIAAGAELFCRAEPTLDGFITSGITRSTLRPSAALPACSRSRLAFSIDHGRFDFADPAEREAEPAAVIVALGDDADTPIDLVAWPLDAPGRFASLFGDVLMLGADRVGNPASYFAGAASANLQDAAALAASRLHRRGGDRSAWRQDRSAACLGPIAGEDIHHARALQKLSHMPAGRVLAPLRAA